MIFLADTNQDRSQVAEEMKIYLAARFSRQIELRGYADTLRALGHTVTSRWLGQHDESTYEELTPAGCLRCADHDVEDVFAADTLISFTEPVGVPNTSRGGRHVEFGIALALGKWLWLVGPRENVFHWRSDILLFSSFDGVIARLLVERFHT